jgi:hypothetical protein
MMTLGNRCRGWSGTDWLGTLLQLHFPIGRMLRRAERSGGLRGPEFDVAVGGHPVGSLDGPEPGGHARLAGGDGLAVAPA